MLDNNYDVDITRGRSELNDQIFDYLKPVIRGNWLDIGCNGGALLQEIPDGVGVDLSLQMINLAKSRNLDVYHSPAETLPFDDYKFDTVVLSCVLEQCSDPFKALDEAIRVTKKGGKVIGINPVPKSEWGVIGNWVKSIIEPDELVKLYKAKIVYPDIVGKYYFEIKC